MKSILKKALLGFTVLLLIGTMACSGPSVNTGEETTARAAASVNSTSYGRLTGVNWFGFETSGYVVHGLWTRDYKSMLQQISDLGFNCIRLPWSNEMLGKMPNGIQINAYGVDGYTGEMGMNTDLAGLSSLEVMDKIIEESERLGLYIILDNHSRHADGYMNETLWYTDDFTEEEWIADWVFMAERYQNNSNVIGFDLNNEPHGNNGMGMKPPAGWGYDHAGYPHTDWKAAAERCGQAILNVNPSALILVEGVEEYNGNTYWWGGNLSGVRDYPITAIPENNLIYSPHEYGPTVHPQSWFFAPDFPANMPAIWDQQFWFIQKEGIGHLLFGEFGIKEEAAADPSSLDYIWFTSFLEYVGHQASWTFWCMNPNSGDTGGILDGDWVTVNEAKYNLIKPYLEPRGTDTVPPAAPSGLTVDSGSYWNSLDLDWNDNSESDLANYRVYRAPSASGPFSLLKVVAASETADTSLAETTTYYYRITAVDTSGNESSATAVKNGTTGTEPADTTPPAVPTGLTASAEGTDTINLDWADNNEADFSAYRVYLMDNGSSLLATVTGSSYTHTGLSPETAYSYSVTAVDNSGNESAPTAAVTETTEDETTTPEGDIAVEYKNGSTDLTTQALRPQTRVVNNGTEDLDLTDITVRYYFTPDQPLANYRVAVDYAAVGSSAVTTSIGGNGTLAYLEIGFTAAADIPGWMGGTGQAGVLPAGASTGDIQVRVFDGTSWQNQDQSNDYSYGTQTSFAPSAKLTAYLANSLVWGDLP